MSNIELINRLELFITDHEYTNIGFSGISFKPNTDDIRNSPIITVIKNLISEKQSYQRRFKISLYDHPKTLKNFSKEIGLDVDIVKDVNKLGDTCDVIILGPYKISDTAVLQMLKQNKIIIDLKWHMLCNAIISHDNYYSLV